jgi:chemotaxis signal transduction protein
MITQKLYPYSAEDDAVLMARAQAIEPEVEVSERTPINLLCFRIAGVRCAIDAGRVRHLLRGDAAVAVPFAPSFLRGIAFYQGVFLSVIGLSELLDAPDKGDRHSPFLAVLGDGETRLCIALEGDPTSQTLDTAPRVPEDQEMPDWLQSVTEGVVDDPTGPLALVSTIAVTLHPQLLHVLESAPEGAPTC